MTDELGARRRKLPVVDHGSRDRPNHLKRDGSCDRQWRCLDRGFPLGTAIIAPPPPHSKSRGNRGADASGGDFKRFPFATPEALRDSGLDFAALAHVRENITVRALLWALSLSGWGPKSKSTKCDADHIRHGALLICHGSRDAFLWKKESCYDLEFRPHERSALRNSRHAACDVVDLRSRVRREPRRSGMPAAITRPGRY